MWRGRVLKERADGSPSPSPVTRYILSRGRVLLIEFLPWNTGPVATCVRAVRNPTLGHRLCGRMGSGFLPSSLSQPICQLKPALSPRDPGTQILVIAYKYEWALFMFSEMEKAPLNYLWTCYFHQFFYSQSWKENSIQSECAEAGVLHVLFVFCYPVRRVIAVVEASIKGGGILSGTS